MSAGNFKARMALLFAIFISCTQCETIKYSEEKVITYEDENEGTMKFTYSTYLQGEGPYKTGWLKGKIEIADKKHYGQDKQTQSFGWHDTVWTYDGSGKQSMHISMEFGLPDRELEYREQVRYIRPVEDPGDGSVDSYGFKKDLKTIKDFNATGNDKIRESMFAFNSLEENNPAFGQANVNGYTVTGGTFDASTKTISVEFTRPFDVSHDYSFHLQPEKTYRLHIIWGFVPGFSESVLKESKGMKGLLKKEGRTEPYNKGVDWVLPKPPGWDDLLTAKKVEEVQKQKQVDEGAFKTGLSLISTLLLAVLAYY